MHWGGMADLEGQPTAIVEHVAAIGALLERHGHLFLEAEPVLPEVALLYSKPNAIVLQGVGQAAFLLECLRGAYAALWEAGIPAGFVSADELAAGRLDGCRALLLPGVFLLSQAEGVAVRAFVERGGSALVGAKCAMLDERGWYQPRRPGAGLDALCGVVERGIEVVEPNRCFITLPDGLTMPAAQHRAALELLASDCEVVGSWEDGTPAAVARRVGAGRVLYVGTHLERACLDDGGAAHAVLHAFLRAAGVQAPVRRLEPAPAPGALDIHLLRGARHALLVALTARDEPQRCAVELAWPHNTLRALDLRADAPLAATLRSGAAELTLEVPARGWSVVALLDQ
jgi:beta-galactosidase